MLELSDTLLKKGHTIFISKPVGKNKLQGTYVKKSGEGLCYSELPQAELLPLIHLPNIVEQLDAGKIMQVHQLGISAYGVIGQKKTEGEYCGTEYLEVVGQMSAYNYYEMLIDLDTQLASQNKQTAGKAVQYIKLYKGAERYE